MTSVTLFAFQVSFRNVRCCLQAYHHSLYVRVVFVLLVVFCVFAAFVVVLFAPCTCPMYIHFGLMLLFTFTVFARADTITFLWPKLRKLYPSHYFLVIFPFSISYSVRTVWAIRCAVVRSVFLVWSVGVYALLSFAAVSFSYWYCALVRGRSSTLVHSHSYAHVHISLSLSPFRICIYIEC